MFSIQPVCINSSPALCTFLIQHWGGETIVSRGRIHNVTSLNGFAMMHGMELLGLITYVIRGDACEVVTLDSVVENQGIGAALLNAVSVHAKAQGCSRLWLITSNDNIQAIRFYQKRGFTMSALHVNAIMEARRLKPQIPLIGFDGIPILHEIEFEKAL